MFRNEFTAKIGFTRTLDRTCPKCGGMYSSNEFGYCPKCNSPLTVPTYTTDKGTKAYCFTEVTLYPLMRQNMKDNHAKRTAASKGVLYTIRMVLWGRYDTERNVILPDPRVRYLVPKRTIRVLFNNPPTLVPFTAKDNSQKIEMKFIFDSRDGDQLEFLDAKQEAAVKESESVRPGAVASDNDPSLAEMRKQLAILTELAVKSGAVLPALTPEESAMEITDELDYPGTEVMSKEAGVLNPFEV